MGWNRFSFSKLFHVSKKGLKFLNNNGNPTARVIAIIKIRSNYHYGIDLSFLLYRQLPMSTHDLLISILQPCIGGTGTIAWLSNW